MIRIVALCPDCGEVKLGRDEVQLVISNVPHASRYSFTCPHCLAWVSKPAAPPAVQMLAGNCVTRHERAPAELSEPHNGPPISLDDLIDLGLQMADTDLLARHAGR